MFKVLIWDYVGVSAQWLEQVADKKDIEVVGTITPTEPATEILLKKNAWDWLLIFEQGARNFFDTTIQVLKLPLEKVVYALDMNSWSQHPKATYTLLNSVSGGMVRRKVLLGEFKNSNAFVTCTVEGLSYVATSADNTIMDNMYIQRVNWASNEMRLFYELAKKYYNVDDSAGYFLDLGANIGTTGIYFTKKLAPNLKLLAFEPDPENFKMHRVNLILNDMEDKATLINCGLGDKFDEMTMYKSLENPGGNGMFLGLLLNEDLPTETVKIIPLDSYLAENKISAQDVKYIWIDTEGFEPQVLLGAKNLLKENPAPIFMEFNPMLWNKSGFYEQMMKLLKDCCYTHYILIHELEQTGKEKVYPIEELWNFKKSTAWIGSLGDIFLIRRGALIA